MVHIRGGWQWRHYCQVLMEVAASNGTNATADNVLPPGEAENCDATRTPG